MKFYFPFPFSDKIFCDIQHVMNRRNIIAGSRTVRLIRTPAALIYHAVLCCIFAVSLSIIHETQIPFTFFRNFLKKVFGALSVSQSSTASELNLSVTGFAVTAPLVGEPLAGRRVFGVWRFAPVCPAGARPNPCGRCHFWSRQAIIAKNEPYAKASPTRGGGKTVRF